MSAEAARIMRSLELIDEITVKLTVLVGFDQDLEAEATSAYNGIHVLLTHFLQLRKRPWLTPGYSAVTQLPERHGFPVGLRKAGSRRLVEVICLKAPHMANQLIGDVFDTLNERAIFS